MSILYFLQEMFMAVAFIAIIANAGTIWACLIHGNNMATKSSITSIVNNVSC
jgi:hypothetical protein